MFIQKNGWRDGWGPSIIIKMILFTYNTDMWEFEFPNSIGVSICLSRDDQSSLIGWCLFSQSTWVFFWKHAWFGMLPKLLKMADHCNGQHPRHETLFPSSSISDLLQDSQKLWSIVLLQIRLKTMRLAPIYYTWNRAHPQKDVNLTQLFGVLYLFKTNIL